MTKGSDRLIKYALAAVLIVVSVAYLAVACTPEIRVISQFFG
jgi:hypothetical protein